MTDENKIECPHCNYSWHSKSKKIWACCPNCMRKFHNPNAELNLAAAPRRAKTITI